MHAIVQPCRPTTNKDFQAVKGLCDIYMILNLECCKWDFTVQIVQWNCAFVHLKGNIVHNQIVSNLKFGCLIQVHKSSNKSIITFIIC